MEKGHLLRLSIDCILMMVVLYVANFLLVDLLMAEKLEAAIIILVAGFSCASLLFLFCAGSIDGRQYRLIIFLATIDAIFIAELFNFASSKISLKVGHFIIASVICGIVFSGILGRNLEDGKTSYLFGIIAFISPLFSFLAVWKNNPVFIFLGIALYGVVIAAALLPLADYPLEMVQKEVLKENEVEKYTTEVDPLYTP